MIGWFLFAERSEMGDAVVGFIHSTFCGGDVSRQKHQGSTPLSQWA